MNTAASSIKAWISGSKSGNITPNSAALAAGVLDMAEMLEGFAKRLRELLQQFHEVEQLSDDDQHVTKRLLDAFLTEKHLQALAR